MKKILYIFSLVFVFPFFANSQEYKTAIGGRVGTSNGISLKHFIGSDDRKQIGLEGMFNWRYGGKSVVLLCELQKEIHLGMRNAALCYYGGIGPHVGFYNASSTFKDRNKDGYGKSVTNFGADLVFGLEYMFADFPITLGVDIRPYYDLINPGQDYYDAGATLRWTINKKTRRF